MANDRTLSLLPSRALILAFGLGIGGAALASGGPPEPASCDFAAFVEETDPAGLNVRAEPSSAAPVLGKLPPVWTDGSRMRARVLVKVGPSLGLLGTLIPMGSSLASLATGNLEAMAGQMVVAFTTTIIGLATGTLAYVVAAARQSWVNETIREQRFIAEHIEQELRTKNEELRTKNEERRTTNNEELRTVESS